MKRIRSKLLAYGPYFVAVVVLISLVQDNPFFWDTTSQASRRSTWFFEQGLSTILLPYELDSGHPTGFNLYLATCWTLLGRTLAVSHWVMLPILLGIVYQVVTINQELFSKNQIKWANLLVLTDVTLLAQATLVSPDLVLLLGYLLGLRGLLQDRKGLVIVGGMLLVSVSLRGIFGLTALGLTALVLDLYRHKSLDIQRLFKVVLPLLPAALLISAFYTWHFVQTGWWVVTPNPNWAGHRQVLSGTGILRNIGLVGWRLLDFGRLGYWVIFGIFLWQWWRTRRTITTNMFFSLLWPVAFLLVLAGSMILLSNPINHRYFLPAFLGLNTLGAYLILERFKFASRRILYVAVLCLQLTGHAWMYPKQIAQAWDASLNYLPYLSLRQDALDFVSSSSLELKDIGTEFPAIGPLDYYDLSGRTDGFNNYKNPTPYLFYASVMNDFSDELLIEMEQWEVIWQKQYLGHSAIIYKRPE